MKRNINVNLAKENFAFDSAERSHLEIWLRELLSILHVERLRYELSGNPLKFSRIWSPVLEHMNDQ